MSSRGNHECWDAVWNPIRGCSPVSTGCANCVSARMAGHLVYLDHGNTYGGLVRWRRDGQPEWTGVVRQFPEYLNPPMSLMLNQRILVGSMGDLFHPKVHDWFIRDVFLAMMDNDHNTFYVPTKYTLPMEQWFGSWAAGEVADAALESGRDWPLANVSIGISAETQALLDERAAHLMAIPAAKRFLLLEPLISQVDLTRVECPVMRGEPCSMCEEEAGHPVSECVDGYYNILQEGIDWVVAGCETGPRHRTRAIPMDWIRDLRDQCDANNIPFYFKQATDGQGARISLPILDGQQCQELPR